jgi:hypothetical protein
LPLGYDCLLSDCGDPCFSGDLGSAKSELGKQKKTCSESLVVQLAGTVFYIPRKYSPAIEIENSLGATSLLVDDCQAPGAVPISARSIGFLFDRPEADFAPGLRARLPHQIVLSFGAGRSAASAAAYHDRLSYFERRRRHEYERMSEDHGWIPYRFKQHSVPTYFFWAKDVPTPTKNFRWYVSCSPTGIVTRDIALGRFCQTSYHVDPSTIVSVRFYDGRHPISAWLGLESEVVRFVKELEREKPR